MYGDRSRADASVIAVSSGSSDSTTSLIPSSESESVVGVKHDGGNESENVVGVNCDGGGGEQSGKAKEIFMEMDGDNARAEASVTTMSVGHPVGDLFTQWVRWSPRG